MKRFFRKKWTTVVAVAALSVWGLSVPMAATQTAPTPYLLIDPGHGGPDGGTVSVDGTLEKEINLAIALSVRDLLAIGGYPVVMTRDTDRSIHDEGVTTLRRQKVSDMQNRLALYQGARLAISIHQNTYPVEKYNGTQVFYGLQNAASAALAEELKAAVTSSLQPQNTRRSKKGKGVFLLERATCPVALVECGFLSNRAEAAKLKDPVYQRQMALCVGMGVISFLAK